MKPLSYLAVFIFIAAQVASAELIYSEDEDKFLHIAESYTALTKDRAGASDPACLPLKEPGKPEDQVLYGGMPLDYWEELFDSKNRELSELNREIADKEIFVDVYERGHMMRVFYLQLKEGRGDLERAREALERGAMYTPEQRARYELYKDEIEEGREDAASLVKEIEELRRKATIYGVPREVRE